MKNLLTLTAALEAGTGIGLLALPSLVATLLLGVALDSSVALTVARVAGTAVFALGAACWFARRDAQSRAAKGVAGAMLIYNVGVAALLAYAGIGLGLSGIALWPAVVLHAAMTGWCVVCLRSKSAGV